MRPEHLKLLGYYHLFGGILGCTLVGFELISGQAMGTKLTLVYAVFFVFFAYSVYCGSVALKREARRFVRLAFLCQLPQISVLSYPDVLAYQLCSGAGINVVCRLEPEVEIGATFTLTKFFFSSGPIAEACIGLNLVALLLVIKLGQLLRSEPGEERVAYPAEP